MGCQLNHENRNESTDDELNIKITPREKKMVINQVIVRPQAIITQNIMFPQNIDGQNNVIKENQSSQAQAFNSGRYVPLSTIQPAEQLYSADLTPLLLIKQMGNSEFKDNEINQETTEKPSKGSKKHNRKINMKTLEAQF